MGDMGAALIVDADGQVADADDRALEMLGVTFEQLRTLPPGAFNAQPADPDADRAFRSSWEARRSPDLVGESTIKLLDGTLKRIRFAIVPLDSGQFRIILEPAESPVGQAPKVYTAGQVLSEWRAAERRLADLPPGSADADAVRAEIERFRTTYQEIFTRRS
jgi:PAS domain-containing protein